MKKLLLFIFVVLFSTISFAQNIIGDWYGSINIENSTIPLIFHISKKNNTYSATLDSPLQQSSGIEATAINYNAGKLDLIVGRHDLQYKAVWSGGKLVGNLTQRNTDYFLVLTKELKPLQEPKPPFSYLTEEVRFQNPQAEVNLAGLLNVPEGNGPFPAVLLLGGSGPTDRDNTGNNDYKMFLVLADYLTRQGIAVLRYDKRGVGASTGDFSLAGLQDFASDAKAALHYLQTRGEINTNQMGLIGHSEGGLLAAMLAASSKEIGFVITLAAPGIDGDTNFILQRKLISKSKGISEEKWLAKLDFLENVVDQVKSAERPKELERSIEKVVVSYLERTKSEIPYGMSTEDYTAMLVDQYTHPYVQDLIKIVPRQSFRQVTCPVLALNGSKDLQVAPQQNLPAIQQALEAGGNTDVTVKEFPNLNHLFQESETGNPGEYGQIEQTFLPLVLKKVTEWILQKTN